MSLLSARASDVSKPVSAALLLAACARLAQLDLARPTTSEVLAATAVSRSRAYELKGRLEALLPQLTKRAGRPAQPKVSPPCSGVPGVIRDYLMDHPGSVTTGDGRRHYSAGFKHLVVQLAEQHSGLSRQDFAALVGVPMGSLKAWLVSDDDEQQTSQGQEKPTSYAPKKPQIQTVIAEFRRWEGGFLAFCTHVQQHCGIPFGRSPISQILEADGVRIPRRRPGRSPDESALRDSLVTFFPHAQWVGDGAVVPIAVDGQIYVFNFELNVDMYSGAFVGANVSAVEDSAAVIAALHDAIEATGRRPIALLLDNKPSNHTGSVQEALDETILIPATPFRPQNKAHVEGGFGLLKPTLKGLTLRSDGTEQLAATFLRALIIVACRAINHRPRRDRGGRSRADLLGDTPSPEEIENARHALQETLRKQKLRRQTLAARQDPVVRATLADAFGRLDLDDPKGHFLTAAARYPLDAVVEGVAIYEGRLKRDSLPAGVDVRYLLGIIRNIAQEREGWAISEALWRGRVAAQDLLADQLQKQRSSVSAGVTNPAERIISYVDRSLSTDSRINRFFWLTAAADVITDQSREIHKHLFRLASRRIQSMHAVSDRDRQTATRFLAAKVRPLS